MFENLSFRWKCGLLVLCVIALYANTIGHDFALDDAIVLTDNSYTKKGIAGWGDLLSNDTFKGFFKTDKGALVAGGRYRPLSPMLFALVYDIVGHRPLLFHALNIALYAGCVLLFFSFIRLFLKNLKIPNPKGIAFISAIIFAFHPVHTEVVANVKGADEILSTMGALLCLIYAIKYFIDNKQKYLIISCLSFFLSLLSKENTVTLLAILPLTIYMLKNQQQPKKWWISTAALFGVFIGYFILRSAVLGNAGLMDAPKELLNNPFLKYEGAALVPFSVSERLGTVFYTLLQYLRLLVYPHPLIHDYYPRHIDIYTLSSLWAIVSILIHVAAGVWALLALKKRNLVAYGVLFYLLAMSITSNLVFPVGTNMSERFLFFPSIGFCLIAGYLFNQLFTKNKMVAYGGLVVTVGLFAYKTITRNPAWKNNFILFQTDVKLAPNSAKLRNAAAGSTIHEFEILPAGEQKNIVMQRAIDHASAALAIHPRYKNAHLLKGNAHLYRDEYDQAIQSYDYALQLDPSYKEAQNNKHIAYRMAGRYQGEKKNNIDKSLEYLKQAIELKPDDPETVRLIGVAYGKKGTHTKALEYFDKLNTLVPDNYDYLKLLATALDANGRIDERNQIVEKMKQLKK